MKNTMKHFICVMFTLMLLLTVCLFAGCKDTETEGDGSNIDSVYETATEFYETVTESQTKLDKVADDIYSYWYDAIYNKKYSGNINLAISLAQSSNSTNIEFIKSNETTIQSLYKGLRDSTYSSEVKDVMSAYSSYYEFVVNVSGSFNSYSSSKETLKKDLANALKRLSLEL